VIYKREGKSVWPIKNSAQTVTLWKKNEGNGEKERTLFLVTEKGGHTTKTHLRVF
jgi:hypothetical protein